MKVQLRFSKGLPSHPYIFDVIYLYMIYLNIYLISRMVIILVGVDLQPTDKIFIVFNSDFLTDLSSHSSSIQAYWKTLNQVLQKLSQRLALMSQGEESIIKVSLNASYISDKLVAFKTKPPPIQKDMLSICNDPYTLAQQLTHVELVREAWGGWRKVGGVS